MPLVPINNILPFSHNKYDQHYILSKKDLSWVPKFVPLNSILCKRLNYVQAKPDAVLLRGLHLHEYTLLGFCINYVPKCKFCQNDTKRYKSFTDPFRIHLGVLLWLIVAQLWKGTKRMDVPFFLRSGKPWPFKIKTLRSSGWCVK